MLTPLAITLIVAAAPAVDPDVCRMASVSLALESHDAIDVFRRGHERRSESTDFAWEGEPIHFSLGIVVARYRPPESGLVIHVLRDGRRVLEHSFGEWKVAGSPEGPDGADYGSSVHKGVLDPLPAGMYSFEFVVAGCDRSARRHFGRPRRLEVRTASTPTEKSRLHVYRANRAWRAKDCVNASKELDLAATIQPESASGFVLRADCSQIQGRYTEALSFVTKARAILAESQSTDLGWVIEGLDAQISELKAAIRNHGDPKRAP